MSMIAESHAVSAVLDLAGDGIIGAAAKMLTEDRGTSLVGRQIGAYKILSRLGVGGMGEVYRARDTKLGRDVAIKVLPASVAHDSDHLARFEREARLLAVLNHPHIAAIHGLEDADGVRALILELVDGSTLAECIAAGSLSPGTGERARVRGRGLPLDEALAIARQIAEALEAAHEKGIIHRDLKPANIKVTPDGTSKVLDFGLAELRPDGPGEAGGAGGVDLSQLPTVTATQARDGGWAGTPAYMSPEQARGKPLDKRSDIWAFGCVLYEMLTGRAAFLGETLSDTIAAILSSDADWEALPEGTPANIRRLLQRCLDKDPKRRLRDIGDVRFEIEDALAIGASSDAAAAHGRASRDRLEAPRRPARFAWWAAAGACLLVIGGTAAWYLQRSEDSWRNPLEGAKFARLTDFEGAEQHAAISRDGKFVVFLSDRDGTWDAWVGQVGTGDVQNLTKGRVSELRNPAVRTVGFSPDGSLVTLWNRLLDSTKGALVDGGWVVPTLGGQLRPYLPGIAELDWSPDGAFIYFVTLLYLTTADDGSGPWLHTLDVERRVPHRISAGVGEYTSVAASVGGRRLVATVSGSTAGLWRAPIGDRVIDESGASRIALPAARGLSPRIGPGYILYRAPKGGTDGLWKLADRTTTELWSGLDGRVVAGPAIAPDGRQIAFPVQRRGLTQLYVMNADGTGARQVAEGLDVRGAPAWSPDGQWIAVAANRGREPQLLKIPVGGGTPVPLVEEYSIDPIWSPTGRFLIYSGADVGTTFRVKGVTADGRPHPLPSLILSRGGRRLAFLAGEDTLVVLKGDISHREFWAVDLKTGRERQLTDLGREFAIGDFDVSANGREIVFDRAKDESDIVLIDLPVR